MESTMPLKGQHVVPRNGKWAVRKSGSSKATKIFETQKQAISEGRRLAKSQHTELYIHGRNGRVRGRDSYGPDSHPPDG